jgi:G:T/U-mismatch repair DNA glycosylase
LSGEADAGPIAAGVNIWQPPSISPANARLGFAQKLARWQAVREALTALA